MHHKITIYSALFLSFVSSSLAQLTGVLTYHNDNARSGLNQSEVGLTLTNVNVHKFGSLRSPFLLDGEVHAQVLYVSNISVSGVKHNVVFVATEHDSVYAFDASGKQPSSTQPWLWKVTCLTVHGSACTAGAPAPNVSSVPCADFLGSCTNVFEVGITSTPVLSLNSSTIYLVSKTRETSSVNLGPNCVPFSGTTEFHCYYFALHALNLSNGGEKPGSPVLIQHQGSSPQTRFDALRQNNRSALLLANGNVYVAFGSRGDVHPYSGWIFAYNALNLTPATPIPFISTPAAQTESCSGQSAAIDGGGIWSVGALAADASGSLFLGTGQGTFNGSTNFGDSFLKLSGTTLEVLDFFTPFNQNSLACNDWDAGSGSPILLPTQAGSASVPNLMLVGTKEGIESTHSVQGRIYLVNRDDMGKHSATSDHIIRELIGNSTQPYLMFNTPAYWNHHVYVGPASGKFGNTATPIPLLAFSVNNSVLSASPVSRTAADFVYSGPNPSISSNGNSNAIVWVFSRLRINTATHVTTPAALHAFNAENLSFELYNSSMNSADALAGDISAFTLPTVANGIVYATVYYIPTSGSVPKAKLYLFGLLPKSR
jgi:hypothetical protein